MRETNLHLKRIRHIHAALHALAPLDPLQPALQRGERRRLHARPLGPVDPAEAAQVRDAELAADEPAARLRGEPVVEDLVEALGFGLVAGDGVVDFGRGVAVEMVCFDGCSGQSPDAREGGRESRVPCPCIGPIPLCIQVIHSTHSQYSSLSYGKEILCSLSNFSQRYSWIAMPSKILFALPDVLSTMAGILPLAVGRSLVSTYVVRGRGEEDGGGGGSACTVDFQIPALLLLVLRDVDFVDVVGQAELLKRAGDFLAVGCPGGVPALRCLVHETRRKALLRWVAITDRSLPVLGTWLERCR